MTRRVLWVGAGAGIVLAGLVATVIWLGRNQETLPEPVAQIINQLPGASPRAQPFGQATPAAFTPSAGAVPTTLPTVAPEQEVNIGVTVAYRHTPQFALAIESVERTASRTTTELYAPAEGSPFSLVRVIDVNGNVLTEAQFTVPSFAIFENMGAEPAHQPGTTSEGSIYLVLSLPPGAQAARVVLAAPDGRVLDEETAPGQLQSQLPIWQRWFSSASALAQGSGDDGILTIVLTHEPDAGPAFQGLLSSLNEVVGNLEPWKTYGDSIRVVGLSNSFGVTLGCTTVQLPGGVFPRCVQEGRVIANVARQVPNWDVIFVVVNYPCNCGSVGGGSAAYSRIGAIGSQAGSQLLGHELGHAVGQLVDEYLGDLGVTNFRLGANCFSSEQSCQTAIAPYEEEGGAQCRAGCSTVASFRPSNGLMYQPAAGYGPLETCKLEERIVGLLGLPETRFCKAGGVAPPGTFWGWYKGG